jgi:hypothetical protein
LPWVSVKPLSRAFVVSPLVKLATEPSDCASIVVSSAPASLITVIDLPRKSIRSW